MNAVEPEDITPLTPQEEMTSLRREIADLDIKAAEQRSVIADASAAIAKLDVDKARAILKFENARELIMASQS